MTKKLSLLFLVLSFTLSLFANLFVQVPGDLKSILSSPSMQHWLGTDSIGRDIFWRVLQGFGISILVGTLSLVIALGLGLLIGGLAGWFGNWVDLALMRGTDFFDGLPDLLLSVALLLSFHIVAPPEGSWESVLLLSLALGLVGWTRMARQVRALVLREKTIGYTVAAQVSGADSLRILGNHLWPNIRQPILRFSVMHFPGFVLFEGSLSFFGLGIKQPATSLGLLLQEGWRNLSVAPHLVWAPALFLFLTLLSFESLHRAD